MIEKERIEAIKRDIDLRGYIESKGITLKKNGRDYVSLCPFHEDKNPSLSVNIQKNLWQCLDCGTGHVSGTLPERLPDDEEATSGCYD